MLGASPDAITYPQTKERSSYVRTLGAAAARGDYGRGLRDAGRHRARCFLARAVRGRERRATHRELRRVALAREDRGRGAGLRLGGRTQAEGSAPRRAHRPARAQERARGARGRGPPAFGLHARRAARVRRRARHGRRRTRVHRTPVQIPLHGRAGQRQHLHDPGLDARRPLLGTLDGLRPARPLARRLDGLHQLDRRHRLRGAARRARAAGRDARRRLRRAARAGHPRRLRPDESINGRLERRAASRVAPVLARPLGDSSGRRRVGLRARRVRARAAARGRTSTRR